MLSRNELSPEFGFFEKRLLLGPEMQPTPADVTAETATAMKTRRLNRMSWFIQKRIELEGDFGILKSSLGPYGDGDGDAGGDRDGCGVHRHF